METGGQEQKVGQGRCRVHARALLRRRQHRTRTIDPRGADLDLHRDFQQEFCDSFFTTKDPAPSNVRAFLARHGIVTSNKIKVEEGCIKPKNSLFILGTLAENPGLELAPTPIQEYEEILSSGYVTVRTQVVRLPSEAKSGQVANSSSQQTITDALLQAGISNPAAWAAAGVATAGSAVPDVQVTPGVHVIEGRPQSLVPVPIQIPPRTSTVSTRTQPWC